MELGEHDSDMGGMALPMLYGGHPPNLHESPKLKPGENGTAGTPSDETRLPEHEHEHEHQQLPAPVKKSVRYRECLKNHAASIGGHAIDGCGDFMSSGEDGTLEALKCAACNCHRNFHRREVEGEPPCYYCYSSRSCGGRRRGAAQPIGLLGAPAQQQQHPINATPLALPATNAHVVARSLLQAAGDNDQDGSSSMNMGYMNAYGSMGMMPIMMKKRFRTKFSNEQKEKMCAFAEKVGWRIQKHDDAAVHQFCMDVGVKRHVLKVWMHNNKSHILAAKAQRSEEQQCTSQQ